MERSLDVGGQSGNIPLGEQRLDCPKHGVYTSTGIELRFGRTSRQLWTQCPACKEEELAEERRRAAIAEADKERRRFEERLQMAAIPRRFADRTLGTYRVERDDQRRALKIATDFARNFEARRERGDSLIFFGPPGTGKTHLAVGILQAIMPTYCGVYTSAAGVIRAFRETWSRGASMSERQVLDMLGGVPLLVIDEVGAQYGTESEQHILFELLDRRYRDMGPTILISNLQLKRDGDDDQAGLREVLGERIYDRLREMARAVKLDGESYRGRIQEAG